MAGNMPARPKPGAPFHPRTRRAKGAARRVRPDAGFAPALFAPDGLVDVDAVVAKFGLTKAALAKSLGLAEDTLHRFSRVTAPKTQRRLREFLEILARVEPWAGGRLQALAWYRGRGIPALGEATAEALVKQDQADVVRAWLDAYAAGAYA
jgi:hypothetical protein